MIFRPKGMLIARRACGFALIWSILFFSSVFAQETKKNILFLFADDQREDTISAFGNPHISTPNLDRLVKMGTSFRQNYCFGSNSGAVCVPSRAMVHSGKAWTQITTDLKNTPILPETLGAHGYQTFITGKWHNGSQSILRGFQSGKRVMMGGMSNHAKVPIVDISNDRKKLINKRVGNKMSSELFADALIEFLKSRNPEKPFYAYCAFTAPHDPRQPPLKYKRMYANKRPPLPKNYLPQHPFNNGHMDGGRDENLGPWPRTPDLIREQLSEYYGLISFMDSQIGRIIDQLDKLELWEDTLVIYAADHGLAMGSHGLLGKQSVYEHSMKCPLILVDKSVPQNSQRNNFTYLFDLYPTVLEYAGVAVEPGLVSQSLWPSINGDMSQNRKSVFLPFRNLMRSCRDEQFKIIFYPPINHVQLFDLKSDPDEMINLADRPDLEDTRKKLRTMLVEWQSLVGDKQILEVSTPNPKVIDLTGKSRKPDRWQPDWIINKYFNAYQLQ